MMILIICKKRQEASKNICMCNEHLGLSLSPMGLNTLSTDKNETILGSTATWPRKVDDQSTITWPFTVTRYRSLDSQNQHDLRGLDGKTALDELIYLAPKPTNFSSDTCCSPLESWERLVNLEDCGGLNIFMWPRLPGVSSAWHWKYRLGLMDEQVQPGARKQKT